MACKIRWQVRCRISAMSLEENPAQALKGCQTGCSTVNGGYRYKIVGVRFGTRVELWAVWG
eukprot:1156828-Pelagomonas_calceolata.AAC.5